ncbi:hypothetical protein GCM10017567_57520 [Amycolatopsis bullii]|uniref:Secreted protein n=1 Tax=Amycolatopsis bullii TaxID=941987 RepID=A0ABQ3KK94_9PSEU|nr:hypothetical protein GCM10017567_57520 [Amycolatopsis bullii]
MTRAPKNVLLRSIMLGVVTAAGTGLVLAPAAVLLALGGVLGSDADAWYGIHEHANSRWWAVLATVGIPILWLAGSVTVGIVVGRRYYRRRS